MKKFILIAAAAIALTACNNDDDNYADAPVAAQISATIDNNIGARASETKWAPNDKIGVSMGDRYVNMEYTTVEGDGIFEGTTMYFKNKREPVTLTAYYPYSGVEGASSTIEANTTAENQTPGNQPGFDFLYDKQTATGDDPKVKFSFNHMMSKLSLIFKYGAGATDNTKIESYEIDGLILKGTFNTATGECKAKEEATKPIAMSMNDNADDVASLIVFPQSTADKNVTLTITDNEGQVYACELKFENNTLASGNNYQFTVTVNKTGLTVNASTINEWNNIKSEEIGASAVNPK